MTLAQWCKTNKPKRRQNKLEKFDQEIKQLYAAHYTVEQIQGYLIEQGVHVSQRYIYAFLKINLDQNIKNRDKSLNTQKPVIQEKSDVKIKDTNGEIFGKSDSNFFLKQPKKG